MSGSREGGLKSAAKIKANDPDYYQKLGSMSKAGWIKKGKKPRGFSVATPEQRVAWGKKGGTRSRRKKS